MFVKRQNIFAEFKYLSFLFCFAFDKLTTMICKTCKTTSFI